MDNQKIIDKIIILSLLLFITYDSPHTRLIETSNFQGFSNFRQNRLLANYYATVKCQNLCYLNLSFYFNLLAIFNCYALYHLHVVIASPLHSHHSMCMLFHFISFPVNLSTKLSHFRPFCAISYATCLPLSYQHTLRFTLPHNFSHNHKLFFPRRFFLSTPLTTQTKTLPQPHKLSSIYFNYIISATFAKIVIHFPHFDSTSTRLHSTFIY